MNKTTGAARGRPLSCHRAGYLQSGQQPVPATLVAAAAVVTNNPTNAATSPSIVFFIHVSPAVEGRFLQDGQPVIIPSLRAEVALNVKPIRNVLTLKTTARCVL